MTYSSGFVIIIPDKMTVSQVGTRWTPGLYWTPGVYWRPGFIWDPASIRTNDQYPRLV